MIRIWTMDLETTVDTPFARIRDGWDRIRAAAQVFSTRITTIVRRATLQYPVQWIHLLRPGCVRPDQSAEQVARPGWVEPNAVAARRPAHAGHEDYG